MAVKSVLLALCLSVSVFARQKPFFPKQIREVYVKDFHSDEPSSCTTLDVDLSHAQALAFFKRAKVLDYKTMVDNYPIAPCYIMGTLKYKGALCDWKIFAGGTGSIKSPSYEWYFACDNCDDLFQPK
jgi:hypothetical protein